MADEIKECNWSKKQIAQIADRVREVSKFDPIKETNFEKIVQAFGGTIELSSNQSLEDTINVTGKFKFSITLDENATEERKRFTMAHELGHYFLHSKQGKTPLTAHRLGTSLAEQEANFFAACLLMPEEEFRRQWEKCSGDPDSVRISKMANIFHVSTAAAAARADHLFWQK